MAEYSHLSTPDPEFAKVWEQVKGLYPAPGTITVAGQRHAMNTIVIPSAMDRLRPMLPSKSSYGVTDHTIAVDDGSIVLRCIQPAPKHGESGSFPLLVWFHGGGWISGNLDFDDFYLRILSVELRLSIVNVDYRLVPEHPFPTGLNNCYAALKWTATNAAALSASLSKGFLIAGGSGGAHYAAAIAHRARDDSFFETRKLTGHLLQIPSLLHPQANREKYKADLLSAEQNKDAPVMGKANLDFFFSCLQADPSDLEISPLLLPHENLPPLYIQVTGFDPLRDEGLFYEKLLRTEGGVKTKLDVYPGVPHAFHASFPQLEQSKKWEVDVREGIQWLLGGPRI
ncbi:Alpha/Beta hydrolase protein [Favolaschia claudopus]|uniref:Alpha/Beta hydrolase protein n=1 Tax=Favolaschia claudopus TaxID=2862362 RepID=A0AAW0D5A2_9AGAR